MQTPAGTQYGVVTSGPSDCVREVDPVREVDVASALRSKALLTNSSSSSRSLLLSTSRVEYLYKERNI